MPAVGAPEPVKSPAGADGAHVQSLQSVTSAWPAHRAGISAGIGTGGRAGLDDADDEQGEHGKRDPMRPGGRGDGR
jgi:hypothetical protein